MLDALDRAGELDNTLVVVVGDNGMPFPRAKANCYDAGTHLPLAIRWPARVYNGRTVEDLVSYIDLAPTFLEAAGVKPPGETVGKSLLALLTSGKSGRVEPGRDRVFTARERHSSSRPDNLGYPVRALRTADYLYVRNFAPDRWPAGDPQGAEGFFDIDGSPTKSLVVGAKDSPEHGRFYTLALAKRPAEELYDVRKDPGNLVNLAGRAEYAEVQKRLAAELEQYLRETKDPHALGNGAIFESYPRYSPIRTFK
jgi:uncharacterized sulfatase